MTQQTAPDPSAVIRAAIEAAGGSESVGAHFGVGAAAVRGWWREARVEARNIAELSRIGGGIVSQEAILDAVARAASLRQKAAA